jgi:hypothetical protein
MHGEQEFQRRLQLIERAIRELEATPDAGLRATAQQLVQSIMELHGASLDRLMEIVHEAGAPGDAIIDRLGGDPLVRSLLLLYGLHPLDFATRVRAGVDQACAGLQSHGVAVELTSLNEVDGAVRLRVRPIGLGGGLSPEVLTQLVEDTIRDAAPDATSIVIDGATPENLAPVVPLVLMDRRGRPLNKARDGHATAGDADAPAIALDARATAAAAADAQAIAVEERSA